MHLNIPNLPNIIVIVLSLAYSWEKSPHAMNTLLVFNPHNCVPDWELWLAATAQHQKRIPHSSMSLTWEKIKI